MGDEFLGRRGRQCRHKRQKWNEWDAWDADRRGTGLLRVCAEDSRQWLRRACGRSALRAECRLQQFLRQLREEDPP
jgi:hypothetical protein